MVTRSASFTSKAAQAFPVKAKESIGSVAKKAVKKKPDDQPPTILHQDIIDMETDSTDVDDSLPAPKDSPSSLAKAVQVSTTIPDNSSKTTSPPTSDKQASTSPPTTPKQNRNKEGNAPATPTHHNLSPATCPFRFYYTLQIVAKSPASKTPTAQQCIDGYRDSLVDALEALYKVDKTIALWPFTEPNALENALLMNPQSLGHSIHQLS